MVKKILITAVVSVGLFANVYNLKPKHITKDISCVVGDFAPPTKKNKGFVSNMCYVDMGDSIVVLDAGPTYIFAKEFYELIKKEYPDKKVSYVILSNYHDDRTQGASFFKEKGAKIIGGKMINEDIKNNPQKFERMKHLLPKSVIKGTKVIKADILAGDGYKIKGSKKTLIILKPSKVSEERSDIAVYSPKDSFLFVGNMVFNGRMLNYTKHSNVDGWIKALNKLAKLKAKHIAAGHGDDFSANSYKDTLQYLQILKKTVQKGYDDVADPSDIAKNFPMNNYKKRNIPFYKQLNLHNIENYYNQLDSE